VSTGEEDRKRRGEFVLCPRKKKEVGAYGSIKHATYTHSNICKLAKSVNESEVVAQPD